MNTYLFADIPNAWLLAGWTMIHFLWLGALVALAAGFCRWLLHRASPNVRYVTALTSLTLCAALPIAIATWQSTRPLPLGEGRGEGALVHALNLPIQANESLLHSGKPA